MKRIAPWIEAYLASLFEHLPEGLAICDARQRIIRANPAFCALFGYSQQEMAGRDIDEIVTAGPASHEEARSYSDRVLSGDPIRAELTRYRKDGTPLEVFVLGLPILDEGRIVGVLALYRDISERVRSQQLLEASTAHLEATLRSIGDAVVTTDASGRITGLNPTAEALTGWSVSEARGEAVESVVVLRDGVTGREVENSARKALRGERSVEPAGHTVLVDRRGSRRDIADSAAPIRDGDSTVTGVVMICRDVTESRRLETNYRLLFDSMLDGFALHEMLFDDRGEPADCRFLDVNPAFSRLMGLPAESVGKTLREVLPESDPFWVRTYGDVVRTGRTASFVRFAPLLDRIFEVVAYRTSRNRFAVLFRDITELERARERAEHLNRVLRSIREINRLIVAERDRSRLLKKVCDLFVDERGYLATWAALFDEREGLVSFASSGGDPHVIHVIPVIDMIREGFLPPCAAETLTENPFAELRGREPCCLSCSAGGVRTERPLFLIRLEREGRIYGILGVAFPDGVEPDEEERELLREVADDVAFALSLIEAEEARKQDQEALAESYLKIRQAQEGTIAVLARTVESRDPYTAGHQERTARLARALAERLGLPSPGREAVLFAARLHDIGKIRVPSEILNKPGRLSRLELAMVREHPEAGWEILKDIDFPWPVAEIVRQHHERLDGSGYPRGLAGGTIRLEARIIAVADVVEAMSSHRPYRPAPGLAAALEEIQAGAGKRYDAAVVRACVALFGEGFDLDGEGAI